jgi:hypothetical protein
VSSPLDKSDNFFSQSGVLLFRASNKNRAGANHFDKSDHFFSQSVCPFNESDFFSANRVFYGYEVFHLCTSRHS